MDKENKPVRIVFETSAELQHVLRQIAAKRNIKLKETFEQMVIATAKQEGIPIPSEVKQ